MGQEIGNLSLARAAQRAKFGCRAREFGNEAGRNQATPAHAFEVWIAVRRIFEPTLAGRLLGCAQALRRDGQKRADETHAFAGGNRAHACQPVDPAAPH